MPTEHCQKSRVQAVCCIRSIAVAVAIVVLAGEVAATAKAGNAPSSVKSLWAAFDPRQEPLDAKVVREWEKDGKLLGSKTWKGPQPTLRNLRWVESHEHNR
jgi:hypothetical protein